MASRHQGSCRQLPPGPSDRDRKRRDALLHPRPPPRRQHRPPPSSHCLQLGDLPRPGYAPDPEAVPRLGSAPSAPGANPVPDSPPARKPHAVRTRKPCPGSVVASRSKGPTPRRTTPSVKAAPDPAFAPVSVPAPRPGSCTPPALGSRAPARCPPLGSVAVPAPDSPSSRGPPPARKSHTVRAWKPCPGSVAAPRPGSYPRPTVRKPLGSGAVPGPGVARSSEAASGSGAAPNPEATPRAYRSPAHGSSYRAASRFPRAPAPPPPPPLRTPNSSRAHRRTRCSRLRRPRTPDSSRAHRRTRCSRLRRPAHPTPPVPTAVRAPPPPPPRTPNSSRAHRRTRRPVHPTPSAPTAVRAAPTYPPSPELRSPLERRTAIRARPGFWSGGWA